MKDQGRSDRKRTGGRLKHSSDKKRHQLGRVATPTTLGEPRFKVIDSRGTGQKVNALSTNVAQVATDEGETVTVEIEDVVENPANVNYVRRNIITKGAVIETDEGRARVTSRPGQTGQVNAVLVE
ncbi:MULTISPECIES: 30S ribosomal protein S8e [unclassified Haloparvum]|jgi:small subunit ribosomal protein S8e|uniref:30S ribosomal protein S8e n=1 Tax=Haloparvum sp. PAK95 TaxID=3418962 RepID=UPI003D2F4891